MPTPRVLVLAALAAGCLAIPSRSVAKPRSAVETVLDRYVHAPDPAFAWAVARRVERPRHTELIVDLTSQTWRSEDEVSRPEWRHWLTIVVPNGVATDTALLYVSGGSNDGDAPERGRRTASARRRTRRARSSPN